MGIRIVLVSLVALVLTACGFQLRGSYSLPFDSLYINLPETNEMRAVLKRNIMASTQTKIVNDAESAQAILAITSDLPVKEILSLNSAGRVREFQLVRTVNFRIYDSSKRDLIPPGEIVLRREISFSDAQVLSKESEEGLLWRDIQEDLVQQLLRRLAAARPKPAAEQ